MIDHKDYRNNYIIDPKNNIKILEIIDKSDERKLYLMGLYIEIGNEIITTNFIETCGFFVELKLFGNGNAQNDFFKIESINGITNLSITLSDETKIYISKSQAEVMLIAYQKAISGVNTSRILRCENRDIMKEIRSNNPDRIYPVFKKLGHKKI